MKLVQAGKFGVGVYNIDGSLYAIANYCSHEGAPLCAGYVGGTNEFAPDDARPAASCEGRSVARCPWHSGSSTSPPGSTWRTPQKRVRTYEVDVADGQVYRHA